MSYQLSIILGTAISLRKFRRALFGPDICLVPLLFFPCDGDRPPFTSKGKAKSAGERKKVRRTAECPDSVIDYFHARRSTSRERRVSLFESLLNASGSLASTEMPLRFPRGCREKKRRGCFLETRKLWGEKSYYRSYFNSIRLDVISENTRTLLEIIVRYRIIKFLAFR